MKNKKYFGLIYKCTNIQNNKMYIGQTTQNFERYKKNHIKSALNNSDNDSKYFYCAIRKYGEQNFKWEILGYANSKEELDEFEIETIFFYRSFSANNIKFDNIYGYNMTKGGEAFAGVRRKSRKEIYDKWCILYGEEEADKKMFIWKENNRLGRIGKGSSLKGTTWENLYPDAEVRDNRIKNASKKMSQNRTGKPSWNKGLSSKTDERVRINSERSAKSQKGRVPWNKGMTKETDERVKRNSEATSKTKQQMNLIAWNKGLTKETDERIRQYGENGSKTKKLKNERRREFINGDFEK
jgi:hypothetical protein